MGYRTNGMRTYLNTSRQEVQDKSSRQVGFNLGTYRVWKEEKETSISWFNRSNTLGSF